MATGDVSVSDGGFVKIEGYQELMRTLGQVDHEAYLGTMRAIRAIGGRIQSEARSRAPHDTGHFANSISVGNTPRGLKLKATDEAAGVIEFAHVGAVALSGSRVGKPVGVPYSDPPRSMIPAVKDNEQQVVSDVTKSVQQALDKVRGV